MARSLAAGVAVALVGFAGLLSRTSLLHARSVEVTGHATLSRAEILDISGLGRQTNVVWFDEAAAERRLESVAWIAEAEVTASLPWTIRIAVVERVPVALATDGLREVLVAKDGVALGAPGRGMDARGLPRIELAAVGAVEGSPQSPEGAARVLGAMRPDIREQVQRVEVLLDGTLQVWLRSGPLVRYGAASSPEAKAVAIAQALAWATQEGERIVSLSVVSPGSPAATLAP